MQIKIRPAAILSREVTLRLDTHPLRVDTHPPLRVAILKGDTLHHLNLASSLPDMERAMG